MKIQSKRCRRCKQTTRGTQQGLPGSKHHFFSFSSVRSFDIYFAAAPSTLKYLDLRPLTEKKGEPVKWRSSFLSLSLNVCVCVCSPSVAAGHRGGNISTIQKKTSTAGVYLSAYLNTKLGRGTTENEAAKTHKKNSFHTRRSTPETGFRRSEEKMK